MTDYKVLITTSGTGSRLGELTQNTNKSLVLLQNQPIINYIVNSYPPQIELVFTLGYFGNKVKDYLIKQFPNRKLTFVNVDKYQGEGSSLGYSMLQAKSQLQSPFIFHCNDTLITEPIPSPLEFNWVGGSKGLNPEIFNTNFLSSFTSDSNGYLQTMNRKGATEWNLFHIGLVGIHDYSSFWQILDNLYQKSPQDSSLNDCAVIQIMLSHGSKFKTIEFPHWFDTGNPVSLDFTQKHFNPSSTPRTRPQNRS